VLELDETEEELSSENRELPEIPEIDI